MDVNPYESPPPAPGPGPADKRNPLTLQSFVIEAGTILTILIPANYFLWYLTR